MEFVDLYEQYKKKLEKIITDSYQSYLHSNLSDVEIEHLPCVLHDNIGSGCCFTFDCLESDNNRSLKDIIPDERGKRAYEHLQELIKIKGALEKATEIETTRFIKLLNTLFFSPEENEKNMGCENPSDQYHKILMEMM